MVPKVSLGKAQCHRGSLDPCHHNMLRPKGKFSMSQGSIGHGWQKNKARAKRSQHIWALLVSVSLRLPLAGLDPGCQNTWAVP